MTDEQATDVVDVEPMAWPDGVPPVDEPTNDDPPPKEDGDGEDEKWDANRQKADETAAQARKNSDSLIELQSTVKNLPSQVRDMMAGILAEKAGSDDAPAETTDELAAQIKELVSSEDADFDDIRKAIVDLAKRVTAGPERKDDSEIEALIEKALKPLREKDAARDIEVASDKAQQAVTDHMLKLEREYFDGKSVNRTDVYKMAQEICTRMGHPASNPPSRATGLLAMEMATKEIASKQKAAQQAKDNEVVTDSLAGGRVAKFDGKHCNMDEAVAEMRAEGKMV